MMTRLEHATLIQKASEARTDARRIKLRQADILSSKILKLEQAMEEIEDQNPYFESKEV